VPVLFKPAIRNLKAATARALDNNIAVPRAEFDLPDMSAGAVDLFSDQSRGRQASTLFAFRDVATSMDAESLGRGVEVGLQHGPGHLSARPPARSALPPSGAIGFSISQSQHRLPVNLLGAPEVEDDWIAQPREPRCFAGLLDSLVRISELQISDLAVRRECFIEDDEGHRALI